MKRSKVIIIGGGLAGLSAGIHLVSRGIEVLLFEKRPYPHHKVCGEYLSREILPYVERLGVDLKTEVKIDTFRMSTRKGKVLETKLPMGGLGISRYHLDYQFYLRAKAAGVSFCFRKVKSVLFAKNQFTVIDETGDSYSSEVVVGAYGKRSELDQKMGRSFMSEKSPWVGIKAHYQANDFPKNVVELHNFRGGYGGLSATEKGSVNFCYLSDYKLFKKSKSVENFNKEVVTENPHCREFLLRSKPLFPKPIAIAQFSFQKKKAVEDHIIMCGDTAGLIHPLCGNGMAMAIHSAKIASDCIMTFFSSDHNRSKMEFDYSKNWSRSFSERLAYGRKIQSLLLQPRLADVLFNIASKSPWLVNSLIKRTHGNTVL